MQVPGCNILNWISYKDKDEDENYLLKIVTNIIAMMLIIMLLEMMNICSNSHGPELSFLFNIVTQSMVFTR